MGTKIRENPVDLLKSAEITLVSPVSTRGGMERDQDGNIIDPKIEELNKKVTH